MRPINFNKKELIWRIYMKALCPIWDSGSDIYIAIRMWHYATANLDTCRSIDFETG